MNLWQQIDALTPEEIEGLKITATNTTAFTGDKVAAYLKARFGFYICPNNFYQTWALYQSTAAYNFARAYDALRTAYAIIDNRTENVTRYALHNNGDETNTRTDDTLQTNIATDVENVGSITTFDSTNFRNGDKSVQNGTTTNANTGTVTNAKSHTATSLAFNGETLAADDINAEKIEKRGRVGDISESLAKELEVRQNNLIENYIDTFVARYCYLAFFGGLY